MRTQCPVPLTADPPPAAPAAPGDGGEDEFHLFMATDGQPLFLCTLNAHMLLHDADPAAGTPNCNAFAALGRVVRFRVP